MTKKLLTYCKVKLVKGFSKKFASLFCRCVVSHLSDEDDSDGDRYYQYNNNCNFIYINIVK
ncbi:AcOrf-72 peptide [Autographa californica nucleopolyhedrovirus]|uniref:Uncharacterized 7.1 kDa protein in IAP2-VLF1 intergenic region n=3 Tax=Alphabaculovirus aucalifornicae TaxID=3047383 RepID=Y072_NPVAC|nr:AcOrf-72 peptide [Autographa californica nucleopolyhedrovirus]P41471.1 RecName: Full=Uncharacterized 7.1 kDa protein in IAP2-VLF1 intergenic region [Autographa californica nucleopolyhedrovirus]ABE68458.1 unknown [Plutella xylostella multiple nucleopolyhedrovirus]AKN58924.1 AcOrf-72 peptide [Autographa californica multiple nucleopolyhedrovirus]ARJ58757.1 Orf-72 protein [synthetic baculovirus AcMNPV-WIV-Syn1]UVY87337.1 Acorf72 protein [synthetic construct]AAA66702.1 AcOrf-72 peptide [Autogra